MKHHLLSRFRHRPGFFINKLRRTAYLSTGMVVAMTGLQLGLISPLAHAQSDATPPTLNSFSLTSDTAGDISNSWGFTVTFAANITDNLSGLSSATELDYTSPSGNQVQHIGLGNIDGDGNWTGTASFPQYSEDGVWTPSFKLVDASGNTSTISNSDLMARGIDANITLSGTEDVDAPVINSASVDQASSSFDQSTSAGGLVTVDVNISDLAGMHSLTTMYYTSPSGKQVQSASINGSGVDGDWIFQVQFPQYAELGTWTPSFLLMDALGNKTTVSNADLLAKGINLSATITGVSADTAAPTLSTAKIGLASPVVDAMPYGGAIVSVDAQISDDLSGVASGTMTYTSPDGQVASADFNNQGNGHWIASPSLPSYAQSGYWQPSMTFRDSAGNSFTYTASDLANRGLSLVFSVTKNVTGNVAPGGTLSSDEENDGTNVNDPVEASVTTPSGGPVSIVIVSSDSITDAANGYQFFDRQISISAPVESTDNPLTLTFQIDSSKIPAGEDENTLQITKNGSVIPACTDQTTATPDPCVFSRVRLADGSIKVSIHTSTASVWGSGFPIHNTAPSYAFKGFLAPVANPPTVNRWEAGAVVPLRFTVNGHKNLDILNKDYPKVQQIDCKSGVPIGSAQTATSATKQGLSYVLGSYWYLWKTPRTMLGTCQQFQLGLNDNSSHVATFKFNNL